MRCLRCSPCSCCSQVTKCEDYNEKVDVFSLGCLMYELFARELRSAALLAQVPDGELLRQYALQVRLLQLSLAPGTLHTHVGLLLQLHHHRAHHADSAPGLGLFLHTCMEMCLKYPAQG